MLQHKLVVEWEDGKEACSAPHNSHGLGRIRKQDTSTPTLELLGDPNGFSAMSRSVDMSCGIAAQFLLEGYLAPNIHGILAPYEKKTCDPLRKKLVPEGFLMVDKIS